MKLGHFIKTPQERKRYVVDYSEWLDTGESVGSYTTTVTPSGELTVYSSALVNSNKGISLFIDAGSAGKQYLVTVKATTSGGQIKEDVIQFSVRNAS